MGPPITPQTKSVVYKAVQYYKAKKADPTTAEYRDDINVNKTVAKITGLSEQSVRRIVNEGKAMGDNVTFTAPVRRKQVRKKRIKIDEFTKGTVRRKVSEYYTLRNENPSIEKVRKVLADEGILKCGYTYMRLLLKELGFQYKYCENKKKVLIENRSIVQRRGKYIRDIRKYRAEGRPIFFKEEIFVSETDKKSNVAATSSSHDGDASSARHRLVIVHAGGSTGFVDGSRTIFKTHVKGEAEDNQGKPDFTDFVWVCEKLLHSLPPNSVIVMDHPKKIDEDEDREPTKCSSKDEIQEWLTRNHIAYTAAMSKKDLLELVQKNKPKQEFKMDVILKEQGRTVLYLPLHHPELNPIQLVWADIKSELLQKHAKSDLPEKERALEELLFGYSHEKWQKCDSHVQTVEDEYLKNERLSDEVMNQLQLQSDVGESDKESCPNHSDEDSDMDTD